MVTGTERTDVTDADAPPGTELYYSVFAARGGDVWSPPAIAPAMFIPEVADMSVTDPVSGSGMRNPTYRRLASAAAVPVRVPMTAAAAVVVTMAGFPQQDLVT